MRHRGRGVSNAVEKLKLTNADVDGVRADVSLRAELQAAADATVSRYGRVHILVNNAGVGSSGGYGRWTDGSGDRATRLMSLNGTFLLIHRQTRLDSSDRFALGHS
jgi:NAD(P)-dependent dehydrogenase (short-subunit alcohol dehydrogenase family)